LSEIDRYGVDFLAKGCLNTLLPLHSRLATFLVHDNVSKIWWSRRVVWLLELLVL
jgi:hypothetical protein